MKLHIGALPDTFEPEGNWRPIIEPSPIMLQVWATPVALLSGGLFFAMWQWIIEFKTPELPASWEPLWPYLILASFPVLIMVHEVLHALFYPGFGMSQATLIGWWPSHMMFYAYYDGEMPRNRFLLVFVTPFLFISVLPLVIAALVPLPHLVASMCAWFSIWNALFACGDILGFCLILWQVPKQAMVRNKSWQSFWRPCSAEAEL